MRIPFLTFLITTGLLSPGLTPGESGSQEANVVEIVARGLEFQGPTEVESGWTTFRLINESGMTHFAVVQRLPEGIDIDDHQTTVAPVFQQGMDLLAQGDQDAAMAKFGELPPWFGEVVFLGGLGLIAPGMTGQTTVHLDPGTYLLECYLKTDGRFHSFNPDPGERGMVHQIRVTDSPSEAPRPEPTIRLSISSEQGIQTQEEVTPGEHTVAVYFSDQATYEHFLGHDVHLARLTDDTDLHELARWMNWMRPGGLETPAPAQFLGGTQEMPSGETAYFTVDLDPGRYAWISEVPDPSAKHMMKVFTVRPRP